MSVIQMRLPWLAMRASGQHDGCPFFVYTGDMRSFAQRALLALFKHSYGPSLYIKLANSLYRIPEKVEHHKENTTSLQDVMQGVLNSSIIPFHLNRIWPYWVYRQFNPNSPDYCCSGLPALSINVTHRNWTTLSFPGINEHAVVDPMGLITPLPNSWSVDFWVTHNDTLISPSRLPNVSQSLVHDKPMTFTTVTVADALQASSEAWFVQDMHRQGYVFNRITVSNRSDSPLETSVFVAIRPYNPSGISPISEITYVSSGGFIVDNRLGVVLDEKPDNVVCLTFGDGDVSEHYNEWDMILHSHCTHGLASAFAEYKVHLEPGEERSFVVKMPTTQVAPIKKLLQKTLPTTQKESLNQKITGTRAFDYDEMKTRFVTSWESQFNSLTTLSLPDKTLERLFRQNLAYLQGFVGQDRAYTQTFSLTPAQTHEKVFLLMALNRSGAVDVSESLLLQLPYFKRKASTRHLTGEQAGQLLFAMHDTFLFTHNPAMIQDHFTHLDALVQKLKNDAKKWTPHRSFTDRMSRLLKGYTSQEEYLYSYFWALAGLRSAVEMATIVQEKDKAHHYLTLYQEMNNALNMILLFSMGPSSRSTFIPVSTKRLVDAGLVMSLVSVYPLGMMSHNDERIVRTLDLLDQFMVNKVLFNSIGYSGYTIVQNFQLAQVFALRQDPRAWHILSWVAAHATPTGTWPDAIHPISGGGCGGDGHSGLACAEFIHLIRNLLVTTDGDILNLCPFVPPEWLDGDGITASQLPTPFGRIRFTMKRIESTVVCRIEPDFVHSPLEMRISCPIPYREVVVSGHLISEPQPFIRLEARAQDVIFHL